MAWWYETEIASLQRQNRLLLLENESLRKYNADLEYQIIELVADIEKLEKQRDG